jgi:hypothetical protein
MKKAIDLSSRLVVVTTLVLFVAALFIKGFTHEILLEAAVFLVSVKLILIAHKSTSLNESILKKLDEIQTALGRRS